MALQERGRRMANARWKADRARRDEEEPERWRMLKEIEMVNLPKKQGDALGCFQWHDYRTGKKRKWIIRIGDRSDRMTVDLPEGKTTKSHGWTWILTMLRKHLSKH